MKDCLMVKRFSFHCIPKFCKYLGKDGGKINKTRIDNIEKGYRMSRRENFHYMVQSRNSFQPSLVPFNEYTILELGEKPQGCH